MDDLDTKSDRLERVRTVVKWLIGNGIADNQEKVGNLLGYKNKSSFSQILNGKVSLPSGFTYKLAKLDSRLNEAWISDGWDKMTNDTKNPKNNPDMYEEGITKDQKINELQEELARYKAIVDAMTGRTGISNKQTGT